MTKHNNINAYKQRAVKLMGQGKFQAAKEVASKVCKKDPNDAEAQYILGSIYCGMKRYQDAIDLFKTCIKLQPGVFVAYMNLGTAYAALNDFPTAEEVYRKALPLTKDDEQLKTQLAMVIAEQGRLSEAQDILNDILKRNPASAAALDLLGDIYYQKHQYKEAIQYYEKVLSESPDRIDTLSHMGIALYRTGFSNKAVNHFEKVARLEPENASVFAYIGHCMKQNGDAEKSKAAYNRALEIAPDNLTASVGIIDLYERQGGFKEAYELLLEQIHKGRIEIDLATAYVRLCHRFGCCNEAMEYSHEVLQKADTADYDISRLEYAIGRSFDKQGDYDEAFSHYQRANKLSQKNYDPNTHSRFVESLIQTYSWPFFTQAPRASVLSDIPVFIVGMPRSGTSLTEQILSSHPDVYGAGELTDIGDAVISLGTAYQQFGYPSCMNQISSDELDDISTAYLEHLDSLRSTECRVTDKSPSNFLHLGLIALAFPQARIIHCTRDPLDNCLSIYFQGFSDANLYANDLEHIGLYYREYERFMQHIKGIINLPVFELKYEELVNNQETISRQMIEFVDLDWDERCLEFHNNKRFVATPSYDQVRENIYTTAISRWKNYEKHLVSLKNILK